MGPAMAPGGHVLDVTCGPGLVARELAGRGLRVTGVDVAPAAIRHARELCRDLPCDFVLADVRAMEPAPGAFDAALYLFGQPTVQRPDDMATVLRRIAAALRPGGRAALEILRADRVDRSSTTSWWTSAGGLFGDGEHLVLYERSVDGEAEAVVERYHVIDAATGELRVHGLADRILPVEALGEALGRAGLDVLDVHLGWDGADVEGADQFVVVIAERPWRHGQDRHLVVGAGMDDERAAVDVDGAVRVLDEAGPADHGAGPVDEDRRGVVGTAGDDRRGEGAADTSAGESERGSQGRKAVLPAPVGVSRYQQHD
jgi:SAM-dependent methyltransferase